MLESLLVDFNPSRGVSKWRVLDEGWWALVGNDVQKVIETLSNLTINCALERGSHIVLVYLNELLLHVALDSLFFCNLLDNWSVFGTRWEHVAPDWPVLNFCGSFFLLEIIMGKEDDLHWSTSTLDWHLRECEKSFPSLEPFSQLGELVGIVEIVHGAYSSVGVIKSILSSFDT